VDSERASILVIGSNRLKLESLKKEPGPMIKSRPGGHGGYSAEASRTLASARSSIASARSLASSKDCTRAGLVKNSASLCNWSNASSHWATASWPSKVNKLPASLEAVRGRRGRLEDFKRDKEALLEYHARLVPEDLDGLTSEQRRTLYRMMRLKVWAAPDGKTPNLIAEWGCNVLTTLQCSSISTTRAFRFRALLREGATKLELTWI
jgi:hypothetical protein